MKHNKHSSNFPDHMNLLDMLVQTYNMSFGNKIYCFLNYKLGNVFYLLKTYVASEYFCHKDHTVFFPWPTNIKTESHPVKVN